MIKIVGAIILILTILGTAIAGTNFPDNWRPPTVEETPDLLNYRSESDQRYLVVESDFNGDEKSDVAKFLVNDNMNSIGLFVLLSQPQGMKLFKLYESDSIEHIRTLGIGEAAPGSYKTACGKGYFECEPNEPDQINLENPAIDFFNLGGANAYFYWDKGTESFKEIWMSD